jgi:hypothetical protein
MPVGLTGRSSPGRRPRLPATDRQDRAGDAAVVAADRHQVSSPVSLTRLPGSQDRAAVLLAASMVDPVKVTPLGAKVTAAVPTLWTTAWVPAASTGIVHIADDDPVKIFSRPLSDWDKGVRAADAVLSRPVVGERTTVGIQAGQGGKRETGDVAGGYLQIAFDDIDVDVRAVGCDRDFVAARGDMTEL